MSGATCPNGCSFTGGFPGLHLAEGFDLPNKMSHRLKLLALSTELMRLPKVRKGACAVSVGLVEEARNRRKGRKEHGVHWDRVEINGQEFPSQRADMTTMSAASGTHEATDGLGQGYTKMGSRCIVDESSPSYLLVGHSTCDLCLMTFEASSVSGVVTMKRILEARRDWGMLSEGKLDAAASNLYDPARLCMLCSQFFCPREDGTGETALTPCGVGRSNERVSLTLESMASNKPLPGTASKTTALHKQTSRPTQQDEAYGYIRNPLRVTLSPNFRLDELIEDDGLDVRETDLARQPGVTAAQSSTADDMGADVCLGRSVLDCLESKMSLFGMPSLPESKANEVMVLQPGALGSGIDPNGSLEQRGDRDVEEAPAIVKRARPQVHETPVARTCSRTRREKQPWWEVNLGSVFPIRCVRIHHPDRRAEVTKAGAPPIVNVAPFWIMTAARAIGDAGPDEAREMAVACKRIRNHQKISVWDLGANHFASAVRVQAEGVKSLQLARVEIIKGGGTQQAMDLVQQQCFLRENERFHQGDASDPGGGISSSWAPMRAKSRRASEHTNMMRRLQGYYAERRAESSVGPPTATQGQASRPAALPGSTYPSATGPAGGIRATTVSTTVSKAPVPLVDTAGEAGISPQQTLAGNTGVICLTQDDELPRNRSTRGRSRGSSRRSRSLNMESQGEDVQRLLLRAMVGYDWVDDFNVQELKLRGAFTERDVELLEDIFVHCALGDDVESRAAMSVSCMHLDPVDLCGDLRRLQLQVQTSSSNKGKPPMLLAIRESSNLLQLLSSGIVETLQDAFARAEAQLPPEQRPLSLDWAHFLGAMAMCLDGALRGAGAVSSSALARLFEEAQDDRLDFLTRRRPFLPDSRRKTAPEALPGVSWRAELSEGVPRRAQTTQALARRSEWEPGASLGSNAEDQTMAWGWGTSSCATEDVSTREETPVDARETILDESASRVATRRHERVHEAPKTKWSPRKRNNRYEGQENILNTTGGRSASLNSLMRPQGKHEVWRGYRQSMMKRRERQREAMLRAAEPDIAPTRAYKPCGLCQAFFPAECLVSTASLKVLGNFLAKAGAPNEHFERKASSLCALHRLPLCVFCSQFFDPDLPEGIVSPDGHAFGGPGRRDNGVSSPRVGNNLVPFFDDRFPQRWCDTPLPLSAPVLAACKSESHFESKGGVGTGLTSRLPFAARAVLRGSCGGSSSAMADVGQGGKAKELREAGNLVRAGFYIRDHLDPGKS